jgi:hypothetical protein
MKSYPTGVAQNFSAPGVPPSLGPVVQQNWRMFAGPQDAKTGLDMIQTVAANAFMQPCYTSMYAQFVYVVTPPPIVVRIAYGSCVPIEGGDPVTIMEYPSDIFDRYASPQPFVDSVTYGQTPVLKCRTIAPGLGELYWTTQTTQ